MYVLFIKYKYLLLHNLYMYIFINKYTYIHLIDPTATNIHNVNSSLDINLVIALTRNIWWH